jgi:ABC-2 type transport system ATP-binding protein
MSVQSDGIMLEVNNLGKNFGAFQALKGVSFEVSKGDVFGFLGPNGAGKTTAMRIVTCFMPASEGTVKVAGLDVREHDLEIRTKIGYLAEANPLYSDMLVEESLEFTGRIRGLATDVLRKRVDEMCDICNLSSMRRRHIGKLSKGYRQRVGLAQALMHNPDLLILDEPMSGLDPNQIIEIRQLIKRIGREKTVIYCSHILSEVAATCNRILIINNGRTVASGTPDELTQNIGKGARFLACVKGDKDSAVREFGALPGATGARVRASSGEWHDIEVGGKDERLGEAIFGSAVKNHWVLSELKRESASLEDVFIQLTKG